jgi:hypothetical protein
MAVTRTASLVCCAALWAAVAGCATKPRPITSRDDCAQADAYDFRNISDFTGGQAGWYLYADNTPGGVPDPSVTSNVAITQLDPPGRCGDTGIIELQASGHNYYGVGFGDYAHNNDGSRADGTGYDGISFWARSPGNTDKTFMLYVDDGRTIVLPPTPPGPGLLPVATPADQDLDGDGLVGPGDIARGTKCRLPPPAALGQPACYFGGAQAPATPTRVPEPDECGNQFHTYVTTTDDWQLFLLPWDQLTQWPCPNRLDGGLDHADVAKIEIKFIQGSTYDLWLDNIAFYRLRQDAGSGN